MWEGLRMYLNNINFEGPPRVPVVAPEACLDKLPSRILIRPIKIVAVTLSVEKNKAHLQNKHSLFTME